MLVWIKLPKNLFIAKFYRLYDCVCFVWVNDQPKYQMRSFEKCLAFTYFLNMFLYVPNYLCILIWTVNNSTYTFIPTRNSLIIDNIPIFLFCFELYSWYKHTEIICNILYDRRHIYSLISALMSYFFIFFELIRHTKKNITICKIWPKKITPITQFSEIIHKQIV